MMFRNVVTMMGVGAVFASGAFAAGFEINQDAASELGTSSSGEVATEDCTAGLKLDVQNGGSASYDATLNDFSVTGVRVAAADSDGTPVALGDVCEGFAVTAVLKHAPGDQAIISRTVEHLVGAGDGLVVLALAADASPVWVDDLTEVSVLVDQPDVVPAAAPTPAGIQAFAPVESLWTHHTGQYHGVPTPNVQSKLPQKTVPWGTAGLEHFQSSCDSPPFYGGPIARTRWVEFTAPQRMYRASVFSSTMQNDGQYGYHYTSESVLLDANTMEVVNRSIASSTGWSITFFRDQHRLIDTDLGYVEEGTELIAGALHCLVTADGVDDEATTTPPSANHGLFGVSYYTAAS